MCLPWSSRFGLKFKPTEGLFVNNGLEIASCRRNLAVDLVSPPGIISEMLD